MEDKPQPRFGRRWWGALALVATGLVAWRLMAVPEVRTLRYAEHAQALADVRRAAGRGPHPAMLLIHGGGWQGGSRLDMANEARWLADMGITTVSIGYRLTSGGARWPDPRQDVIQAMWWLREHAADLDIDPRRIGVFGHSAGGHLGAWLATTDEVNGRGTHSRPQLLIAWGAPWDLSRTGDYEPAIQAAIRRLVGTGDPGLASPLGHIDDRSAPMLLIHGPQDVTVAPAQSRRACEAMRRMRVECQLVEPPGEGHVGLRDPANTAAVQGALRRFIQTHLAP